MEKPITICDRCDNATSCLLDYDGTACRKNRSVEPTNADLIRSMTDEELANFISDVAICTHCKAKELDKKQPCVGLYAGCKGNWLSWLQAEVRDGD